MLLSLKPLGELLGEEMLSKERMSKLVKETAALNSRLVKKLHRFNLDFLIWVSPSSCRDPEETRLWHPTYSQKSRLIKMAIFFYIFFLYSAVGLMRFFTYKGFYYNYSKKTSTILLVIPDDITDHSKEARTDYLIEDAAYPVNKLVFSRSKNIGYKCYSLTYSSKFGIFTRLLSVILSDFKEQLRNKKIGAEYLDAFMILLRWVISQSWQFHWDFYHLLRQETASHFAECKILLCLHEMHFYSRVVWKVADEKDLLGVTAQHAMIVPEKLWYFPQRMEIEAFCPIPGIFFVYSDEIKDMLQPYYPGTKFFLYCNPRFNKWKAALLDLKKDNLSTRRPMVTFVSGIMNYDITILLKAIKNLLKRKDSMPAQITLRLHPHGSIDLRDKMWIRSALVASKIRISNASLKDDLANSSLIVGSNSTVLQEAVLLGVPTLGILHKNFISHSILPDSKEWYVYADELSWEKVKEQSHKSLDAALISRFKKNMGLFSPDFTTRLIYETCRAD